MKRMIFGLIPLLLILPLTAEQTGPQQILKKGDVQRFIETFPQLSSDLEQLGLAWEAKSGSLTAPEAMQASEQVRAVLAKHGWDENFFAKTARILQGYSLIKYGQAMGQADARMAASIQQIDQNPAMTPEMKARMKEQIRQAMTAVGRQKLELKNQVHPAELVLIKSHLDALAAVLQDKKDG